MEQNGQPKAARALTPPSHPNAGLVELFLLFSQLGLSSFGGGVSAWIHRAFVEQRGWIGENEFSAALALSRIMPGANVVNLAVVIGQRIRGAAGSIAAVLGLLTGPSILVIAFAVVYDSFADVRLVQNMLEGTAAAAVGLILAMAVASARALLDGFTGSPVRVLQSATALVFIVAVFVLIGVLRLSLVATVLCLAPISIALTAFMARRSVMVETDDR